MSDTPRTDRLLTAILDAHGFVHRHNCPPQWVMFARELERELNAANAKIKRLEVAGNQLKDRYILENENWDLKTVNDWNEAMEAKP